MLNGDLAKTTGTYRNGLRLAVRDVSRQGLGLAMAAVLSLLCLAAPAVADDLPNPAAQAQIASNPAMTGALPEGAGIMDRARPDYDAAGIPMGGSFLFYPSFAGSLTADGNIYRTATGEIGDLFGTLSPRLELRSQWQPDTLRLYAQLDDYRYVDHDTESRTNWIGGGAGEVFLASGLRLDADSSYFSTHESRASPDSPAAALSPTAYTLFHTDATIINQPGPLGLSAGVNYDRYEYDPTALVGGGTLDNADRNSRILEAFGKASYDFELGVSAFARASYNVRDFDLEFDRAGYDHASHGYRLDTGLQLLLSPLVKGTLFVGYLQQDFKTPLKTVSGIDFGSQIDWFVTQLLTVHFTSSRQLSDTTLAGASSEDARRVGASFDYELLRNLILQGNVGYENDVFDGITRDDRVLSAGITANYLITRTVSTYAGYEHDQRETNVAGGDFSDDLVTVGLKLQY